MAELPVPPLEPFERYGINGILLWCIFTVNAGLAALVWYLIARQRPALDKAHAEEVKIARDALDKERVAFQEMFHREMALERQRCTDEFKLERDQRTEELKLEREAEVKKTEAMIRNFEQRHLSVETLLARTQEAMATQQRITQEALTRQQDAIVKNQVSIERLIALAERPRR